MSVVLVEKRPPLAFVTINRPEAMNALNAEVQRRLRETWEELEADEQVRVAILTGAGEKAFSAGADLKEYAQRGQERARRPQPPRLGPASAPSVSMLSKPVIAAINGYCLAGALELALACDLRIASENAVFGCPEVKWNVLHGYGALRLPHAIPMAWAMEMLLTGEFINAQQALAIGLVSRVVPPDQLLSTCEDIGKKIAANGQLAVRITKQLAYASLRMGLDQALHLYGSLNALNALSPDTVEGPTAFTEKRAPRFQGA